MAVVTDPDTLTRHMTEKQLQEAVIQCARLLGYECYHTFDSRRSAAGFPDLVMVARESRPARLLYAELKAERGRFSPAQGRWLRLLARAGAEVYVWYPSDWTSGRIERALKGEQP